MSNNFTQKAENALNRAVKLAEEYGHTYIGTEHILLALAKDESCCASILLKKNKITKEQIASTIKEYSGSGHKSVLTSKDTTPKCRRILENSYKIMKKYSAEKIGTEHLLMAIIDERECVASKILSKMDADTVALKDSLIVFMRTTDRGTVFAEPITESNIPNLLKYGKNITALAVKGELDPVIGRDRETDRVIRIISRRTKNNPCLIGEAGVGKTAIIEGLAIRIAEGRVPPSLIGKIIISLDLSSMVSGAKYRGDFEERIKNIMTEAARNKSVILFIDEIHNIVGAGSAEGAIDAANIMKPELARGDIQLIGATTIDEYRRFIEKDGALERRFQPVTVEEASLSATIDILNGLKLRYEAHHGVLIDQSAIEAAARLSERYIQDRFLPDKALDLMDEACALASGCADSKNLKTQDLKEKIRQTSVEKKKAVGEKDFEMAKNLGDLEKLYNIELSDELTQITTGGEAIVTEKEILRIINEITGIDALSDEGPKVERIRENISKRIIGQESAVNAVTEALTRSFAGINSPDRPRGIFLFLGESGVGKTALATTLAKELFESDESIIRYDMSEYSESYSVSKLIGSAPGYVGYDERNSGLERIRKRPYSIVLLDEIEKAHPDVLSLFLGAFDTGYMTDASGRKINFRNCYVIMTTNAGAGLNADRICGFASTKSRGNVREKLKESFKEEFLNRIDDIILFSPLNLSALVEIARSKIMEIQERVSLFGINLTIEPTVYEIIAKEAKEEPSCGARGLMRIVINRVETPLANILVNSPPNARNNIHLYEESGKIQIKGVVPALRGI